MSNQSFDPMKSLGSLRDSVSRIIEDGLSAVGGAHTLPLDIYETEQAVIVLAGPLVGIQPEGIDVSVTGDTLTIRGETKADTTISEDSYLRRERRFGPFARAVKIPRPIQPDQAVADFKDGILIVTLPKVPDEEPKVINIRTFNA